MLKSPTLKLPPVFRRASTTQTTTRLRPPVKGGRIIEDEGLTVIANRGMQRRVRVAATGYKQDDGKFAGLRIPKTAFSFDLRRRRGVL